MVRLPDIRILALLNHAVYLILQLPLPYRPGQKTEEDTSAGGSRGDRQPASGGQTPPKLDYAAGAPPPEEYLLGKAV